MSDYTPRNWALTTFHVDKIKDIPVTDSDIPERSILGVSSPLAAEAEARGEKLFYYDLEQLEAGLDKTYGLTSLEALSEDHTFPDGVQGKKGALVAFVTCIDMSTFAQTIMVEQL